MAIDWDAELLAPIMSVFGEGDAADQSMWPLYMLAGGGQFSLADAVFDSQSETVETSVDLSVSTTRTPVLGVRLSLFPRNPKQDDTVFIPSAKCVFMVSDVRPDGHGWAKLILMTAAEQVIRTYPAGHTIWAPRFCPEIDGPALRAVPITTAVWPR